LSACLLPAPPSLTYSAAAVYELLFSFLTIKVSILSYRTLLTPTQQVQEVAAHLNIHLPHHEGDDSGSTTSRRKPPPPPPRTNLAAITLKNHPLSLPPSVSSKAATAPPPPIVVDEFGAPAPPADALATDPGSWGANAGGGIRRPQAARRGGAGAVGGRKIVER
jgi:hypothetical protein